MLHAQRGTYTKNHTYCQNWTALFIVQSAVLP